MSSFQNKVVFPFQNVGVYITMRVTIIKERWEKIDDRNSNK